MPKHIMPQTSKLLCDMIITINNEIHRLDCPKFSIQGYV